MKEFFKYHGAGNDFVMIDNRDGGFDLTPEKVKSLCHRHFGVGADGLILLESSDKADCFMNYYNSDGSLAEMCGNGVRCTAQFFIDITKSGKNEISIDTRAGIKKIIKNDDGTFSVNMGQSKFTSTDFPAQALELEGFNFSFASMGNPHAVALVPNISKINLSEVGPKIETNPHFPNKINVEFVEKVRDDYFKVIVWERGCGATLACGTGACAVYAILNNESRAKGEVVLEFPGGKLYLSENDEDEIVLRGEATFVFKGELINNGDQKQQTFFRKIFSRSFG